MIAVNKVAHMPGEDDRPDQTRERMRRIHDHVNADKACDKVRPRRPDIGRRVDILEQVHDKECTSGALRHRPVRT